MEIITLHKKITVRDADNDLASVTVNGKQEAGTEISLSADNQNNRKKEYTIIAEDRRGNSTSCKITINPLFRPSEKDLASVCGHSKGYRQSVSAKHIERRGNSS